MKQILTEEETNTENDILLEPEIDTDKQTEPETFIEEIQETQRVDIFLEFKNESATCDSKEMIIPQIKFEQPNLYSVESNFICLHKIIK